MLARALWCSRSGSVVARAYRPIQYKALRGPHYLGFGTSSQSQLLVRSSSRKLCSSTPRPKTPEPSSPPASNATASEAPASTSKTPGEAYRELEAKYTRLETDLMKRVHISSQRTFRTIAATFLGVVWTFSIFGAEIKAFFSKHTAEVASKSLQHEDLQVQTQALATAVVQTVLNDPQVLVKATEFVKYVVTTPDAKGTFVEVVREVFRDPVIIAEATVLGKKVVANLVANPETVKELISLLLTCLNDADVRAVVSEVAAAAARDPVVMAAVQEVAMATVSHPEVQAATNALLLHSVHHAMNDGDVVAHAKVFVGEVVEDDSVQRTGGDALLNTIRYSITNLWGTTSSPAPPAPAPPAPAPAPSPTVVAGTDGDEKGKERGGGDTKK